jgi:SNF family Na+-dependent transporter
MYINKILKTVHLLVVLLLKTISNPSSSLDILNQNTYELSVGMGCIKLSYSSLKPNTKSGPVFLFQIFYDRQ